MCTDCILGELITNCVVQGFSARRGRTVDGRKEKEKRREEEEGSCSKKGMLNIKKQNPMLMGYFCFITSKCWFSCCYS